jgi:hypothetical protein
MSLEVKPTLTDYIEAMLEQTRQKHYRELNRRAYEYVYKTVTIDEMHSSLADTFKYINNIKTFNFVRQHYIRYYESKVKEYDNKGVSL